MMNSGSESRNPLSQKPSSAAHSSRNLSSRAAHAADAASPRKEASAWAARKENGRAAANGYDSDAETDILSDAEKPKAKPKKKRSSIESSHRQRSSPSVVKSEPSRSQPTSRRSSMTAGSTKDAKRVNGVDRKDGDSKKSASTKLRPVEKATSSSSRAQSAEASLSAGSSAPSETAYDSPDRTRQSLSVEPRKRKLSDEHPKSRLEPPRQRPRLDPAATKPKRLSSPASNPPASAGHRRSISNQSGIARPASRKRRDASVTSQQSDDRKKWADDSSDDSSPPPRKDKSIPRLAPTTSRSLSQRALTSPARTNLLHSRRADKYGTTPLAKACEKGQLDAVKKAYEQAPEELDQEDNGGFTPLQKAALGGHFEVVKFLLDKGCRKDCFSKEERDTPLIDAVENGHFKVVKLLLNKGVNPFHANKKGVRAIDAVDYEEDFAKEIEIALREAMDNYQGTEEKQQDDVVVRQQERLVIPSSSRRDGGGLRPDLLYQALTPDNLLKYSTNGDLEAMGMILESVEPTVACAVAAARGGHVDALGLLLGTAQSMEKDPSPLKYEETPMLAAIGRGHLKVIELLLDQDNFNPCRKTRDGKAYYEIAAERRGPRWQQEHELLKARYDAHKEHAASGKKREPKSKSISKDISPKSPRLSKATARKSITVEEDKEKEKEKEKEKKKRLSSGSTKDLGASKDLTRKRRVVDEDSSEATSDHEHPRRRPHGSSKTQRKTSLTGSSLKQKDDHSPQPSSPRAKFARKPKVKREDVDGDNDIIMDDAPTTNGRSEERASKMKQREEAAERRAREEAEAQLRAETEAREKQELEARQREEAEQARLAEEERLRKRKIFLATLPLMLRRAVEQGMDRPMKGHLPTVHPEYKDVPVVDNYPPRPAAQESPLWVKGVKDAFLPLMTVKLCDIDWSISDPRYDHPEDAGHELYILSHHVVGIFGLSDLDLKTHYPRWQTIPATEQHLSTFVRCYNVFNLEWEYNWYFAGCNHYDEDKSRKWFEQSKSRFISLWPQLSWVKLSDFTSAFEELKATPKGKKLEELGEIKPRLYRKLRRPRPPGYDPRTDPENKVYVVSKPMPTHIRSGLGSVYIKPGSKEDLENPMPPLPPEFIKSLEARGIRTPTRSSLSSTSAAGSPTVVNGVNNIGVGTPKADEGREGERDEEDTVMRD
jgi:ankyrin repeat protein